MSEWHLLDCSQRTMARFVTTPVVPIAVNVFNGVVYRQQDLPCNWSSLVNFSSRCFTLCCNSDSGRWVCVKYSSWCIVACRGGSRKSSGYESSQTCSASTSVLEHTVQFTSMYHDFKLPSQPMVIYCFAFSDVGYKAMPELTTKAGFH